MVEDMGTLRTGKNSGRHRQPGFVYKRVKGFVDRLNADHTRGLIVPDFLTRQTLGISFYDSMFAFRQG